MEINSRMWSEEAILLCVRAGCGHEQPGSVVRVKLATSSSLEEKADNPPPPHMKVTSKLVHVPSGLCAVCVLMQGLLLQVWCGILEQCFPCRPCGYHITCGESVACYI